MSSIKICLMALSAFLLCMENQATATLVFYYDPGTGNVSFDTAGTRSGKTYSYSLEVNPYATDVRFRTDNIIRPFNSTLGLFRETSIGDASISSPISGYFTIGNVLPSELDEVMWADLFSEPKTRNYFPGNDQLGHNSYLDVIGQGEPPIAEFVYGQPDREFDNRWDLIDPDTLVWAEAASIIYRPENGEVLLDTTGEHSGYISSFLLRSDGDFLGENFTALQGDGALVTASDSLITEFTDSIEPGVYSLGKILPAGMSYHEVVDATYGSSFIGRAGFGGNLDFDLESEAMSFTVLIQSVPEPSSFFLACLPAVGYGYPIRRRLT